ncbi:hypothetical protein Z043_105016 [Scleropages formosus]|uniref:Uncharacterized protein n=1 Tax=Scleropages formosus TaxID=113540 RepID=A0A0P7VJ89_SCLFO|nr:hypothetical protein Z043_105016 [Scleropages formosus]
MKSPAWGPSQGFADFRPPRPPRNSSTGPAALTTLSSAAATGHRRYGKGLNRAPINAELFRRRNEGHVDVYGALKMSSLAKQCSRDVAVSTKSDTDPRVLEKQELQQPTYVALSYINRFMTDAARREQETLKKKIQPKLSLPLTGSMSRNSVSTPPRHSSGSLTPPVTPPITPSSSFRSSTPTVAPSHSSQSQRSLAAPQHLPSRSLIYCMADVRRIIVGSGSEYDEEEVDYEESDSDESWTTESAISSESILSSMCMNGGDEKPFACPVPGCKKRYKASDGDSCGMAGGQDGSQMAGGLEMNVNGIKYHAKNGHRTQIRVRKPFKCRCGKSYKTSQGLRHHTINFHPPVSADIIRKMQQ